jgi:hypothetical protein
VRHTWERKESIACSGANDGARLERMTPVMATISAHMPIAMSTMLSDVNTQANHSGALTAAGPKKRKPSDCTTRTDTGGP